ncbi:MAG: periplasmic heavy metal sensor [Verrucomicrobia bacterium]|nr:periplasmic heavy metal sensor [Verrucomicrobiota bacterium]
MSLKSLITMSVMAVALQISPVTFGQDDDQPMGRGRWEKRLANLSPEERQKLQAAHQKAMQDPAVQAAHDKMREAHKEFRDAMKAAMLKADPSIQPILSKIPGRKRGEN